jgi:hypothetical protein
MIHTGYNLEAKWAPLVDEIYTVVLGRLRDKALDSESRQVCILTASDIVSVCHEQLGDAKVKEMFGCIIDCLKNDNLQEIALKGLTLIALHETSDLRAREEAKMQETTQQTLVPVLNRQVTSSGAVPN